jgi:SAM-dependent methyltransferase
LQCVDCGRRFAIEEGIFKFDVVDSTHGEFSKEEMRRILTRIAEVGWREALRTEVQQRNPRVVSLIIDPRRALSVAPITAAPGQRVLDFGCGYGGISMVLADSFREVVALDESLERLSVLRHIKHQDGLGNITLVCHHDVLRLPFPNDHFDAVVLVGVLEYLPASIRMASTADAHDDCLREFRRVLMPGGCIWVLTKNRFGWQFLQGQPDHSRMRFAPVLPRRLTDLISRARGRGPYRIINYSLGGYRRLFARNGFIDIRLYWPIPGYQTPDHLVRLDARAMHRVGPLPSGSFSPPKLALLGTLYRLGLLPWIVPAYGLLARKP